MYFIKVFSVKENTWIDKSKHKTELATKANFDTLAEAGVPVQLFSEGKVIKEANFTTERSTQHDLPHLA
jgi:hypothetical protein